MNSGLPVTELNGLEDYMKKNDVFAPMTELFRSQLPNVLMGMRLASTIGAFPEPTDEELKLQWVLNITQGIDFCQSKALYKKWLLLKGFEDIHKAIIVLSR